MRLKKNSNVDDGTIGTVVTESLSVVHTWEWGTLMSVQRNELKTWEGTNLIFDFLF